MLVQWAYSKQCIARPNKTNDVFASAFTMAYGCLKLGRILELSQDEVLYDTCSLIYMNGDGLGGGVL